MPASKEIQANIIAALKESFSPDHLAKPQNMPWRSALFGPSTAAPAPAAKPIRIDLMLMLQQSILKASGVEGGIAKRAEAVPLIVETVRSNPTEVPFLTITDSPNGEAGKELIVYSSSSSENKEADTTTTAAAAPVRPTNSAAANSSTSLEENNNNSNINIDERTIFASPIHFKATDSEIASFFAQYGTVTSVERRRYLVRGVAKLRPSVFVMFASKEDAQKCVSAKPSYGRVSSALGQLFVPQLIVSMKGDPVTRDAISDETEKANVKEQKQQEEGGTENNGGPSHRRLITRGLICVARGVPNDVPVRDVQSKLGSIRGVGKGVIDIAYIPPSDALSQQQQNFSMTTSTAVDSANTKICYIYCTSPQAAANLLQSYNRVFSENEKYAESLGQAIPLLEKCTDSEEEFAMELYSDAVAPRTQKKMERNAAAQHSGGGNNHNHHAKSNNNNRNQNKHSSSSTQSKGSSAVLLQHHDTVRRDRE